MKSHYRNFSKSVNCLSVSDIDLSYNDLPRLPESLYKLVTLKRLNISNNEITELSSMIGKWTI